MHPRRLIALALFAAAPAAAAEPLLLPAPVSAEAGKGAFAVGTATVIVVPPGDRGARNAAERLAEWTLAARGLRLAIVSDAKAPAIRFRRGAAGAAESYALDIAASGATITARDDAGLLYGAVSLWQYLTPDRARGAVSIPAVTVKDAPRFRWRGLMLDSARNFQSPAYIRRLLDWMAVNKLNTFHWHLVDDQGWRLEIRKYPRLTDVSAWRVPATAPGAPPLPRTGGFYTQAEVREIVAYAAARGITIVPEIEMPGHALSALRAYPRLGTGAAIPAGVESDWGVFPWLYNTDDATFAFLEDVLREVMALFPSRYIHVGGDEAVKDQWKASPAIQAKMKSLGIADEDALQSWFIRRMQRFLAANGRRLIGWDEILQGGIAPEATVMSWRGIDGAVAAAKAGHDTVLSPSPALYLNHREGYGPLEPPARGDRIDLRSVYGFDPAPAAIPAEARGHILGVQANLWTEHARTEPRASWMLFPRANALAEVAWSPERSRDFGGFVARLVPQLDRMRALGLEPSASSFTVAPTVDFSPGGTQAKVALANVAGLPIRYTIDGSAVIAASPLYAAPLTLPLATRLRAAAMLGDRALAGAIDTTIDLASVRRQTDEQLATCTDKVKLAVEDDAPANGARASFLTDILNPCWLYRDAPAGGAKQVALTVGQFPFNFQIGADLAAIRFRAPETPDGEFEVRAGSCDGERIAVLPLAPARGKPALTRLVAPLPPRAAKETLCITYTARGVNPMWGLKQVELLP
ncbi:beta-N-acetylhexosaminidase [Sphingomonas lycopersici]|mgnify:CR=1 FL=1|uniref:beta-N-acetylhexosaminidase n=1 Tax=Sphingomonas lycopersici TaxID=2951807 RepID=A0AA42CW23_9SPHN|nr:family 20 glycosylhydrolase [Sphingomonas lycopersici]